MHSMPARRISERSSGKMPTTSVRRPISRLKRSSGFVERSLRQWSAGNPYIQSTDHKNRDETNCRRQAVKGRSLLTGLVQRPKVAPDRERSTSYYDVYWAPDALSTTPAYRALRHSRDRRRRAGPAGRPAGRPANAIAVSRRRAASSPCAVASEPAWPVVRGHAGRGSGRRGLTSRPPGDELGRMRESQCCGERVRRTASEGRQPGCVDMRRDGGCRGALRYARA